MSEKKGMLDSMTPKQTFGVGLVGGILILCTIGFFILLNMVLGGGGVELGDTNAPRPSVPTPTQGNNAPAAPTKISIREVGKDDHVKGAKKPKVTIVEYSDLECPFCSRFHPTVQQIVDKYPNDVAWVYRHFPLTSIHPNATKMAVATECAGDQDKFWEMLDVFFANQRAGAADATLEGYASDLGLNVSTFMSCVSSGKYEDKVTSDANDAVAAGGRGTPYSIILGPDGETVPLSGAQPFSAVEAAIQQFL